MDVLPQVMEAARDKDKDTEHEILQSFEELIGGIAISKELARRTSPYLGQMVCRMKSLAREVEYVIIKHLLQLRG